MTPHYPSPTGTIAFDITPKSNRQDQESTEFTSIVIPTNLLQSAGQGIRLTATGLLAHPGCTLKLLASGGGGTETPVWGGSEEALAAFLSGSWDAVIEVIATGGLDYRCRTRFVAQNAGTDGQSFHSGYNGTGNRSQGDIKLSIVMEAPEEGLYDIMTFEWARVEAFQV